MKNRFWTVLAFIICFAYILYQLGALYLLWQSYEYVMPPGGVTYAVFVLLTFLTLFLPEQVRTWATSMSIMGTSILFFIAGCILQDFDPSMFIVIIGHVLVALFVFLAFRLAATIQTKGM
ncbi:hypothetical protein [Halodesulfovibrio marinisediminis]|uniref:Uncharacterized protein n=1 Tax=Halodesulfovibrio marinisediminis DSM 17456 TaxID=1121457 RepID=A0A1N6FQG5_9BACT|nr:hypothetical protein [Halodesulfovibrio marinisediminis]SIN97499.1 hypothetical protein SAMN02745161_1448 [Halodesulfovibrio marinisediminis DSM 17456]